MRPSANNTATRSSNQVAADCGSNPEAAIESGPIAEKSIAIASGVVVPTIEARTALGRSPPSLSASSSSACCQVFSLSTSVPSMSNSTAASWRWSVTGTSLSRCDDTAGRRR
jgi:hypothetical protein